MISKIIDFAIDLGYGIIWLVLDIAAVVVLFRQFQWIAVVAVVAFSYFLWENVKNAIESATREVDKPGDPSWRT